ncbi:MAG: acetyl-CoA acetyltransferase [Deltaproteobacteria bacterium]|nr:MAG: acetyl-CoA acetyltransferase [Deltaproteobacteria bacterium]
MSEARTPVLVGVGAVTQREADPARAQEPVALMARALERAADDAGSRRWLERADAIAVPRGFWSYADPARRVAELVNAKRAQTWLAEIGVLQTTLFARACAAIAEGRAEVVLVAGGEAKHRASQFERAGGEAPISDRPGEVPDEVWRPFGDILAPIELASHLGMPVRQYAVIENALRHAEGRSLEVHRNEVASLWSEMSRVAAENPDAWTRDFVAVGQIRDASAANRMLAFPYTKLHNSQWNVDQAAGLIFTSAGLARREGVPESRWIHPRAVVESNYMLPLVHRAELHRCAAFRIAGRHAAELASLRLAQLAHLELYSCFPVAVRVQQRELGVPRQRPVTVTGGMAFAGGPLNNFVLQAAVRLAQRLRAEPGGAGMLNAVSGMLTKQGVSLWSSSAGPAFASADVSAEAQRETRRVELAENFSGTARVASYTVLFDGDRPTQTVMLCDTGDGKRAVAVSGDPALAQVGVARELCGVELEIAGDGVKLSH